MLPSWGVAVADRDSVRVPDDRLEGANGTSPTAPVVAVPKPPKPARVHFAIGRAGVEDVPMLQNQWAAFWRSRGHVPSVAEIKEMRPLLVGALSDPFQLLIVARVQENSLPAVAGFLWSEVWARPQGPVRRFVWTAMQFVRPQYRRIGIGSALADRNLDFAREQKASVRFEVAYDKRIVAFRKAKGYRPVAVLMVGLEPGSMNCHG